MVIWQPCQLYPAPAELYAPLLAVQGHQAALYARLENILKQVADSATCLEMAGLHERGAVS